VCKHLQGHTPQSSCLLAGAEPPLAAHHEAKRIRDAELRAAAFEAALLKAELKDIEDGCQLLILPNDASGRPVFWPGMDSNTLFVRPIFRQFFESAELLHEFLDDVPLSRRDKLLRHKLLRGVPGIGKSSFGL